MALEIVRDNQWWFSQSVHRPRVENCGFVVLSIGGRECPLIHSQLGRDGRPTHSFSFLHPADRAFWIALRGSQVDIEIIECGDRTPEIDQADEVDQADQPSVPELLEVPPVSRSCETLFDAYIFVDWSLVAPKDRERQHLDWRGAYDANDCLIVDRPINPHASTGRDRSTRNAK